MLCKSINVAASGHAARCTPDSVPGCQARALLIPKVLVPQLALERPAPHALPGAA